MKISYGYARRLTKDDKIGNRPLRWDVPKDLERFFRKNDDGTFDRYDVIIGIGKTKSEFNKNPYLLIGHGGQFIYLHKEVMEEIIECWNAQKTTTSKKKSGLNNN